MSSTDKLFIVNAYTKLFSLPGVRIGYAISGKENIENMGNYLPEWYMSVFAQRAGVKCAGSLSKYRHVPLRKVFAQRAGVKCAEYLLDTDFVQISKDHIRLYRREISELLKKQGYTVFPSDTCFVLLKTDNDLYNSLLQKKLLIRDCSNFDGLKKGYYRISVSGGKSGLDAFFTESQEQ